MPRPERRFTIADEIMIFDGEDLALDAFMALYGVSIITGYRDGRIKVRTAGGRFTDLRRTFSFEQDRWIFNARDWAEQLREVDAEAGSAFGNPVPPTFHVKPK